MSALLLDRFLTRTQNRLFVTARIATGNEDEALDLVQDTMFKLADKYAERPEQEWPALVQSILQNNIKDWYRRQKVRRILHWWQQADESEDDLPVDQLQSWAPSPEGAHRDEQTGRAIHNALQQLPLRQQQAFILRAWWEHSTAETATIMGCSQGSVKTHYSRALSALEQQLSGYSLGEYQL